MLSKQTLYAIVAFSRWMTCSSFFLFFLMHTTTALDHVDGFGSEVAVDGDTIAVKSFGAVHIFRRRHANTSNNRSNSSTPSSSSSLVEPWIKVQEFEQMGRDPVQVRNQTVFVGDASSNQIHVLQMLENPARRQQQLLLLRRRQKTTRRRRLPEEEQVHRRTSASSFSWRHTTIPRNTSCQKYLGFNVAAVDDQTLFATATGLDGVGSAFLYHTNNNNKKKKFRFVQELDLSPRTPNDVIGQSLAASPNYAIVGGFQHLYVFQRQDDAKLAEDTTTTSGGWKRTHVLKTPHASLNPMSRSLAVDGTTVVAGFSPPVYPFGQGGTVVVYQIQSDGTLRHDQTLVGLLSNFFGLSVALSGNVLAIGAPEEVYIYERQNSQRRFVRTQQIKAALPTTGMDLFGQHVALDGDTLVVGAYLKDGPGGGSAYVFSRKPNGKWTQDQELKGEGDVW